MMAVANRFWSYARAEKDCIHAAGGGAHELHDFIAYSCTTNFLVTSVCSRVQSHLASSLPAMTKPRRVGTFTFDQRGWAKLRRHIQTLVENEELDTNLFAP